MCALKKVGDEEKKLFSKVEKLFKILESAGIGCIVERREKGDHSCTH
jgi:hypothetical protein